MRIQRLQLALTGVLLGAGALGACAPLLAQDTPAPAAPEVVRDFVRPTGFTYGKWRSSIIGGGGYVQNVVPCPTNKSRFYTYVDVAGLSRSDDGGKTWRMLHGALPGEIGNNEVRGLTVDPRDDNKIVIATGGRWGGKQGLYRSDDAGKTFQKVQSCQFYGNGNHRPAGFILDRSPANPDFIVAGAAKDGLFLSRDNGKTWAPGAENLKGTFPTDLRFDRKNPDRLWLCSAGGKLDNFEFMPGFFRSEDGGATWTKLSETYPSEIVQDPVNSGTLYGIFNRALIKRSTDGGTSWEDFSDGLMIAPLAAGKSKESIDKTAYQAFGVGPDFIITCNTRDADVFKLAAGGTKWEKIERNAPEVGDWFHKGGWAFGGAAGSLTVNPHNPNHWFLTDFFAIYQTFDAGKNWRLTVDGLETTVAHCFLQNPVDPGVAYVGLADVGAFVSTDGGARFRKSKTPDDKDVKDADAGGGNMKCMDLNGKLPSRIYGVANRNWFVLWRADQVYVSIDGGQTWTRSPMTGLPDTGKQPCTTIVVDVNDPYTVYLTVAGQVGPGNGGVYKSTDGGARWTWMGQGLPDKSWFFPFDIWAHGKQLAASGDGSLIALSKQNNQVYRFDPATSQWEKCTFNRGGTLWSVAADKLKPGRYFVSTRGEGLYRTDDSGRTWKKVYNRGITYVATDAARAGRVAGGTLDGIVLSTDGGDTWQEMDKSLPARVDCFPGFAGDRLFAASGGSGVFWMPLTEAAAEPVQGKPLAQVPAPATKPLPQLTNLDMEAPGETPAGWQAQAEAGTITLARDTAMATKDRKPEPGNTACLRVTTGDAPTGTVYQEWQNGPWYFRVNGLMRARGEFSRVAVEIQSFDAAGQALPSVVVGQVKPNNGWWDGVARTVTLPAGAARSRLAITYQGKGQIWADNFRLSIPQPLYPQ